MNFYTIEGKKYFNPIQSASREDVTVSLVKLKGYDVENADYSYLNKFKDLDSISNNMKKHIAVAIEKKLIDGFDDGAFRGQDTLTRADADVKDRSYKSYLIAQGNNSLYYIDPSKTIHQVNTLTGKSTKLININDIKVKINSKNYSVSNFRCIYFDKKSQRLMGVSDMTNSEYLQGDTISVVTFSLPDCTYIGQADSSAISPQGYIYTHMVFILSAH